MNPDLDTLATALYTTIDDLLAENPHWTPPRPKIGITPKLSDAELATLAVLQSLLGYDSEARFIRYARTHLRPWFPNIPHRAGYNKRLRRSHHLLQHITAHLARMAPSWWDDVWLVDSTPVECGTSRQTQQRSDLAGYAAYGYTASHHRYFWGLRLHLIAAPSGLPIAYAVAPASADERSICLDMISRHGLTRPEQTLIADKGYRRTSFEQELNQAGITLIRPQLKTEQPRPTRNSYSPSAKPSNRSSRPSKTSSASTAPADAPYPALLYASSNGCLLSPLSSGTTKPPNNPALPVPSSHMTTRTLETTI